jgi:hypothetical protein
VNCPALFAWSHRLLEEVSYAHVSPSTQEISFPSPLPDLWKTAPSEATKTPSIIFYFVLFFPQFIILFLRF